MRQQPTDLDYVFKSTFITDTLRIALFASLIIYSLVAISPDDSLDRPEIFQEISIADSGSISRFGKQLSALSKW